MKKKTKNQDPGVLRLIKIRKSGLIKLFFSRVGIVAVFIILQLIVIMMFYYWMKDYFEWFPRAMALFSIVMFFCLVKSDMDATAKLTWFLLMAVVPVPASIMFWFMENDIGYKSVRRKLKELITETKDILKQDEKIIKDNDIVSSGTDALCRYLNLSGSFPIYNNSAVTYFPLGEDKFKAMLEELKKAESFIFLEYFIIDEGLMWGSVLKILADKAAEGVDVRVMYDGMCEMTTLPSNYSKRLQKLGIKCRPFMRIQPFLSTQYNYRDHRKILVIDGKVAFNGGVNLADEYINHVERFGHWKDTALMIKGDAVQSFTLMFLQMWNMKEADPQWDEFLHSEALSSHDGFIMPYCDNPLDEYKAGESVYIDILYRAKKYVHIMTPYLILDNELEQALKYAAQRGVDVKLILPGIPDKKMAYALAKSYYRYLTQAGVKIYEYTPGFVHAKVFVSDDCKAVVGTINLDYRSLYHHFECATYMYKASCISDIEADYQDTLKKCREVTMKTIWHEKAFYRYMGVIMKLISPLM